MTREPNQSPERPRQLTGKETLERRPQITEEEWEPIRLQLIADEEARAAKWRAIMEASPKDASEG